MDSEINLDIINDKVLFEKIHFQKDLFVMLFTEIANEFPQSRLLKTYAASKGTKVSQGWNLEKRPYQVLDLIRDFDDKNGLNIRLLNWWGQGFYIIVQIGRRNCNLGEIIKRLIQQDFFLSQHNQPFDYFKIFQSTLLLDTENYKVNTVANDIVIVYKKITFPTRISLKKGILDVLNYLIDI